MKLHKSKFVMYMQVMDKCLPGDFVQLVPEKKKYVWPMEQQKASEFTKEKTKHFSQKTASPSSSAAEIWKITHNTPLTWKIINKDPCCWTEGSKG